MAYIELLLLFIYAIVNDTIYQSLARVKVDGGVVFYGVTSVGNPPQQVVTLFEFDTAFTHFRNYPNNQAFNDDFMHDDVFGDVNLIKIANQKFSLPFIFDPFYPQWVKCGDIPCQLSVGLGPGSPIWNRFSNISFGHLGMTFDERSIMSNRARDNALQCAFNSVSLCDIDAAISIHSPSYQLLTQHVTVRFGLDNTPVTYLPEDIFYAIKGTLVPKSNSVGDWPSVTICDQSSKCFTLPNNNVLMSEGSFAELTLRPWTNNYVLIGTSAAENVQFYFFSRQNVLGVYEHPTVLAISTMSLVTAILSSLILAYVATTSFNINVGVAAQITGLEFRAIADFLLCAILPALMFSNSTFSSMLYEESMVMFVFICVTYGCLLAMILMAYSDLITGAWYVLPTTPKERIDKSGLAFVRNMGAFTVGFFNMFCAYLQTYPGGDVETFQFVFMLCYGIFSFFLVLNVIWYCWQLRSIKWFIFTALAILVFGLSTTVGSLAIITPYITNTFGNNATYRNLILIVMGTIVLFISFVGAAVLSIPYLYYMRTSRVPTLKEE